MGPASNRLNNILNLLVNAGFDVKNQTDFYPTLNGDDINHDIHSKTMIDGKEYIYPCY